MIVYVEVMPKEGILDPQGKAVRNALGQLGYDMVGKVEVGKLIRMEMDTEDADAAREKADEMAQKLLYNSNVEQYRILLPGESL